MKTLAFGEIATQTATSAETEAEPVCNIPLCGRPADWEVEMFGKVEYYCERHRPGIPERFMTKVNKK
jgi:hypothetical protein